MILTVRGDKPYAYTLPAAVQFSQTLSCRRPLTMPTYDDIIGNSRRVHFGQQKLKSFVCLTAIVYSIYYCVEYFQFKKSFIYLFLFSTFRTPDNDFSSFSEIVSEISVSIWCASLEIFFIRLHKL